MDDDDVAIDMGAAAAAAFINILKLGMSTTTTSSENPSISGSDAKLVLTVGAFEFESTVTRAPDPNRSVITGTAPVDRDSLLIARCGDVPLKVIERESKFTSSPLSSSIEPMSMGAAGPRIYKDTIGINLRVNQQRNTIHSIVNTHWSGRGTL